MNKWCSTWRCHNMLTITVLLALFAWSPLITGGFPEQMVNSAADFLCWTNIWMDGRFVGDLRRMSLMWCHFNTLRPRQNGRHFADDTFKPIFVNENVRLLIEISLKFVPKGPINNIPALVQIMAWRRPGDKPLSEPMLVCLPTQICVTRPQWVNAYSKKQT